MRRAVSLQVIAWLATASLLPAAEQTAGKKLRLAVATNRPDAIYSVGQPLTFTISVDQQGHPVEEGQISYRLSTDGHGTLAEGTLAVGGGPLVASGQLAEPGFLRCDVTYLAKNGKRHEAIAAAGIDPLKIRPSLPVPEDFDAFWAEQRKKLDELPMEPVLTLVESPDPPFQAKMEIECYDVQVPCLGGMPVSGYFALPKGRRPNSLPAILSLHGAGVRSSNLGVAVRDAKYDALALDINAHGIPNGRTEKYYEDLRNGKLKSYPHDGRESRETSYFLGMYLRLMRAIDFLTTRAEWDGRTLIVHGGSQGGGQAIVAAGLDPRVTALAANVPAMCEHAGKINGWPRLVPRDASGNPDSQILQASRYFDAVNHATRTQAEALVSVGFIDNTCRPTSVYAAYNELQGPKRVINEPQMRHETWPSYTRAEAEFIREHIKKRKHPQIEQSNATIISQTVLTRDGGRYIGWPSITKTRSGELLAVFSGNRDSHICPFGITKIIRSTDNGRTWTEPVLITDTPLDDRDAGILETSDGTLLVSWFTHTGFADNVEELRRYLSAEMINGWREAIAACTPEVRKKWLGNWIRRSTDGGQTWGPLIRTNGSAPHGPIQLRDGRLLYVGNTPRGEDDFAKSQEPAITAEESRDEGLTWQIIGKIVMASEDTGGADEPHVVEFPDGRLVCMIRYEKYDDQDDDCFLRQCESDDGGKTWTTPRKTGIRGVPPHIIRLSGGQLVVAYGFRQKPFGIRACISRDDGRTWDVEREVILSHAHGWDLGYPASVQLDDGSIVTVYYQAEKPGEKTCLMGTHWILKE